jgi:hypothetical protein
MARVVGVLVLLFALAAQAQPLPDPDTEVARRHFQRGRQLYIQHRYTDAIAEFEAARRVKPSPGIEFDIARCHERLEEWAAAADAYERFLASVTDAGRATELRQRVAVLRARAADATRAPVEEKHAPVEEELAPIEEKHPPVEEKRAPPPAPVAPPPAPVAVKPPPAATPPPLYKRWWLWTAVTAGAAAVAVGVGVGVTRSAFHANLPTIGPGAALVRF